MTVLRAGRPENRNSIPSGGRDFSFRHYIQAVSGFPERTVSCSAFTGEDLLFLSCMKTMGVKEAVRTVLGEKSGLL
jgi:hypothetical protein